MKIDYPKCLMLVLLSLTIPIETKISIPILTERISCFFGHCKEEIIHKEFNNIKNLEVLCEHGDVLVETWQQPCVLIELKKSGTKEFLEHATITCHQKNSVLQATSIIKEDCQKEGTLSLRILVPSSISLKIKATQGHITIKNVLGTIEALTESTDISIFNGAQDIIATTTDGNIFIQQETITPNSCINAQNTNGNITWSIPQNISCELQAQSEFGKISSDLFITLYPQTIQINEESFNHFKHYVHGSICQKIDSKKESLALLKTDYGSINITNTSLQNK